MKIAYASDLHLDFHLDGGEEFIRTLDIPDCDLFVIAGDFAQINFYNYEESLVKLCKKAPKVLYVLGNHEYYGSSFYGKTKKIAKKIPNLMVASKAEEFVINGVKFLAATAWFPDMCDHIFYKGLLNDFNYIDKIEPEIYKRNREFDIKLHGIKDEPCIVVTHHMPSYRSINPRFVGSAINRFFVAGEFSSLIETSQIKCWFHGHSHDPVDYTIGNTRIVSNPMGYPNEIVANWDVKTIDIDT
jgi:Icc-related predicted phosphoesterase